MGQLRVDFTGARGGEGPVTLGQGNVLEWIGAQRQERSDILCRFVPVPVGVTAADIGEVLAVLIARHEALRTTIVPGERARQVVTAVGSLTVELTELDGPDVEPLLRESLAGQPFDYAEDLPVRVAVATRDGVPHLVALALSHLATDFASISLVAAQLAAMMADPALRVVGPTAHQPLDQAALEATEPARRRAGAAVRFWENQLRRMPQCVFSVPAAGEEGCREGYLSSPAAGLALPAIVARTGVSHSTVLLAAAATLLAVRTGNARGALVSICGNRFRPGMADYVGTIAQDALVPFELGESTVDAVIRGVQVATMNAYRYSQFEARRLWPVMDRVATERGTRFQRDCVFNDVGAHGEVRVIDPTPPTAVALAAQQSSFSWLPATSYPVAFYFTVISAGSDVRLALYADTRYLPPADIEGFLRGVEALLVASAAREVPVAEVPAITGIVPVDRGDGWVCVDSCWVELAEVRRVLAEATGGQAAVFGSDELVGYVVADEKPQAIHEKCVALLPGRYTAMAPGRYVVCAAAPDDLDDLDAWRSMPVLAEGTGR
ncbi:condensation domain-containing protein [Umezawaea endophytica]|uniref:Condensation domain-containing protein n=1 Tax=Umezawaea endophytica TaxID=1654476 RepID=A0A9X2VX16_9PSEU|nr:condensation domain-containing protein [Umezawaea endophytica]MCS7484521.1 condensation domain-containing protein [Umezawaea endophytica]